MRNNLPEKLFFKTHEIAIMRQFQYVSVSVNTLSAK